MTNTTTTATFAPAWNECTRLGEMLTELKASRARYTEARNERAAAQVNREITALEPAFDRALRTYNRAA